jgi:hypothetical protein
MVVLLGGLLETRARSVDNRDIASGRSKESGRASKIKNGK